MSVDQLQKHYENLKKLGFMVEQQINQAVQEHLNKEEFAEVASIAGAKLASVIEHLQQLVETVSIPLNFPTKKDMANLGKILIQTEEKVDGLEEQIYHLTNLIEGLQKEKKEDPQKQADQDFYEEKPLEHTPKQKPNSKQKKTKKSKKGSKIDLISEASKKYSEELLKNLMSNSQTGDK